ncbi:MAG: hypothetical protein ACI8P2_000512 [Candidatus Latescibacterota bacterium]|jgi:hypothetical protein
MLLLGPTKAHYSIYFCILFSELIMKEEQPKSAEEALYGTTAKPPPIIHNKKDTEHRRHHRHGAKPFSQESSYKPYMFVGAVAVALMLVLFLISK